MEYNFFELIAKAYPIIKLEGYTKGETTNYIKNNYNDLEEASSEEIFEFINWLEERASSRNSDYLNSLLKLRITKVVKEIELNLVLSAIGIYFKDRKEQDLRDNNPSQFVGNVGDTISFTVKDMVAITSRSYSYYGPESTFWRITGTDNNLYMWSTSLYFEKGDTIRAKVKDHRDYRNEKQTIITRGKVIIQGDNHLK